MSANLPTCTQLDIGEHRIPCEICNKGKRDSALSVTVDASGGVFHCFRCGDVGNWKKDGTTFSRAGVSRPSTNTAAKHLTLAQNYLEFWQNLSRLEGIAKSYLDARGCAIPPADGALRYAPSLRHPSGYEGPALVALVTDAVTRQPLTLHRTWIKANGEKADVNPPRMLLGKHRKDGGVIRLWPDDAVTTGLAIAEGIETALSLALAYKPVWACIDAGNMAKFPVLDGIDSLLIGADHDPAGLNAAEQCARRWYQAKREVRIAKPPVPGQDLNDVARAA